MCGIFGIYGQDVPEDFSKWIDTIKYRGPDNTNVQIANDLILGFHRLAINGLNKESDQPMTQDDVTICCNGEIYNYKELAQQHGITLTTGSDCEVLIPLYRKFGLKETCKMIDAEFSLILFDHRSDELWVARDHLGLRGLFYGYYKNSIVFASEAKALGFCEFVEQFPPRAWWSSSSRTFRIYYDFPRIEVRDLSYLSKIRTTLTESVQKRITTSDRPVGFLLSGGLDSSLCVALGVKCFDNPSQAHTFSIGFKGSPDLKYAQIVADYLGTTHSSVEYTEEDFLKEIPETIRVIESYDVTTVRASNGHRLISKYIKETTDIKVVLSGEVSDELTCGYMAFGAIQGSREILEESLRMLSKIHLYDTLRADRAIASNGLEGRYPFASKKFIEVYLSIPGELKTFYKKCRMEKDLLRRSFEGELPSEVLWRKKDGFSDGISDFKRTTSVIMKEYVDAQVSDKEFEERKGKYGSQTKEQYFYRKIFEEFYPERANLIPEQWMPNKKYYGDIITDPSGRILDTF